MRAPSFPPSSTAGLPSAPPAGLPAAGTVAGSRDGDGDGDGNDETLSVVGIAAAIVAVAVCAALVVVVRRRQAHPSPGSTRQPSWAQAGGHAAFGFQPAQSHENPAYVVDESC